MKLKNIEMSNYLTALNSVANKVTGILAYGVARNIRKISNEVSEYDGIRNKTIEKYGEVGEDGFARIELGTEAYDKYIADMSEYDNIEHEVEIFMVSSSALAETTLNANEIMGIEFMIEE
jgi:hypothetical protein